MEDDVQPGGDYPSSKLKLGLTQLTLLAAFVIALFTGIFTIWTATSVWSFPRFLIAAVILVYYPGKYLVDTSGLDLRPIEDLTLSLLLGMTASSLLYWVCSFLSIPHVFLLWPATSTTVWFYRNRRGWQGLRRLQLCVDWSHLLLFGLIVVALLPLTVLPLYYRNLDLGSQGTMSFVTRWRDANLHLAVSQELTHTIPPQIPFFAGRSLTYQLGMDLFAAMFHSVAGVSVLDLAVRFVPTFLVVVTALAVFCFARSWLQSGPLAVLIAFLVFFGEDFSFIPGLLTGSENPWSAWFFSTPTTLSLYHANAMLPATGLLFGGLFCLVKYHTERRKAWLVWTAFLFAVAVEFKVFTTMHLLIALPIAGAVYGLRFRDWRLAKVFLATALFALPFVVYIWYGNQGGARQWTRIDPQTSYIPDALVRLGLLESGVGFRANAVLTGGPVTWKGLLALFGIVLPGYLLGSLGIRVLALPPMLKALRPRSPDTGIRFFAALFVVLGLTIALVTKVTPVEHPDSYNNTVWLYGQSKHIVWIFAAESIRSLLAARQRFRRVAVVGLVLALSVPSSVQLFVARGSQATEASHLDKEQLSLIGFLEKACTRGEVIVSHREIALPIVTMTKCRVPVENLYLDSLVSQADRAERERDIRRFWVQWNRENTRAEILDRYNASYVVVDKRSGDFLPESPVGLRGAGASPGAAKFLEASFENDAFRVYAVSR